MSFEPTFFDQYSIGQMIGVDEIRRKWEFKLDGKHNILIMDENKWTGGREVKLNEVNMPLDA